MIFSSLFFSLDWTSDLSIINAHLNLSNLSIYIKPVHQIEYCGILICSPEQLSIQSYNIYLLKYLVCRVTKCYPTSKVQLKNNRT